MKVLVTGGAGYIGSHTVKALLRDGHTVWVFDHMQIPRIIKIDGALYIEGNLLDENALTKVFESVEFDAVLHFAARIEVEESERRPEIYYRNNVVGTINLLDQIIANKTKYLIFPSSAAVYGIPNETPIPEDHVLNPHNTYGLTKKKMEEAIRAYAKAYPFKYVTFRFFNAAGADPAGELGEYHEPESHLLPIIFDAALGNRSSISVYGTDYETLDGSAVRDYVHVNDLADAHLKALKYLEEGGESEQFNLGSGEGYSVLDTINRVKKITGKEFEVIHAARRAGDPHSLVASNSKAFDKLGWKPKYDMDDIVKTAWDFHSRVRG